jgi:hypothetical protein
MRPMSCGWAPAGTPASIQAGPPASNPSRAARVKPKQVACGEVQTWGEWAALARAACMSDIHAARCAGVLRTGRYSSMPEAPARPRGRSPPFTTAQLQQPAAFAGVGRVRCRRDGPSSELPVGRVQESRQSAPLPRLCLARSMRLAGGKSAPMREAPADAGDAAGSLLEGLGCAAGSAPLHEQHVEVRGGGCARLLYREGQVLLVARGRGMK